MTTQITRLAAEFIFELSKATPEDYLQLKLMMLSAVRHPQVRWSISEVYGRSDGYAESCTAVFAEFLQPGRKRCAGETRTEDSREK